MHLQSFEVNIFQVNFKLRHVKNDLVAQSNKFNIVKLEQWQSNPLPNIMYSRSNNR